ncbi:MAG: hypothetical protein R3B97_01640 [Dehalococcoidia bacterium]|nr:hypothetical protein [Dehalococcoidia bacterium]MCB9486273.1 hypothetical protein [Thermoflexaceae bacterium]
MATAVATTRAVSDGTREDGDHSLRLYRQQLLRELAEVDRRLAGPVTPVR